MWKWISTLLGSAGRASRRGHLVVVLEEEIFCPVSYVRMVNHLQHAPPGWSAELFVLPRDTAAVREHLQNASSHTGLIRG
jgi:hypothetical protein